MLMSLGIQFQVLKAGYWYCFTLTVLLSPEIKPFICKEQKHITFETIWFDKKCCLWEKNLHFDTTRTCVLDFCIH